MKRTQMRWKGYFFCKDFFSGRISLNLSDATAKLLQFSSFIYCLKTNIEVRDGCQPAIPFSRRSRNILQPALPFSRRSRNILQPAIPFSRRSRNIIQPGIPFSSTIRNIIQPGIPFSRRSRNIIQLGIPFSRRSRNIIQLGIPFSRRDRNILWYGCLTVTHAAPNPVIFYAAISNFLVLRVRAE